MATLRKIWDFLRSVPLLGWLLAVIALLVVWVIHSERKRARAESRAWVAEERRVIKVAERIKLDALSGTAKLEREQVMGGTAVRETQLRKREAAIDAGALADSEEFAKAFAEAMRLRRKRRQGGKL